MEPSEYEYLCEQGDRDWWQDGMRACTLAALPPRAPGLARPSTSAPAAAMSCATSSGSGCAARGVEMNAYAVQYAARVGADVEQGRLQEHLAPEQ